jgi:hypothetical protein
MVEHTPAPGYHADMPSVPVARLTERIMLDRLRRRYVTVHGNGPRWVYATHVPDAPGFAARRTADAVAMDMWNSKGLELHGHEVKISRSDWLRELRDPDKATAIGRYCDRWWLVVPDLAIVKAGELPPDWGLLLCSEVGVRAVQPARKRQPVPVDRGFMAAMARAVAKTAAHYAGVAT